MTEGSWETLQELIGAVEALPWGSGVDRDRLRVGSTLHCSVELTVLRGIVDRAKVEPSDGPRSMVRVNSDDAAEVVTERVPVIQADPSAKHWLADGANGEAWALHDRAEEWGRLANLALCEEEGMTPKGIVDAIHTRIRALEFELRHAMRSRARYAPPGRSLTRDQLLAELAKVEGGLPGQVGRPDRPEPGPMPVLAKARKLREGEYVPALVYQAREAATAGDDATCWEVGMPGIREGVRLAMVEAVEPGDIVVLDQSDGVASQVERWDEAVEADAKPKPLPGVDERYMRPVIPPPATPPGYVTRSGEDREV